MKLFKHQSNGRRERFDIIIFHDDFMISPPPKKNAWIAKFAFLIKHESHRVIKNVLTQT